jgi:hypothetical protein
MQNKRVPLNTAAETQRDPLSFLISAMVMGTPGAIEHQEAQGQHNFVGSDTLPTEMYANARVVLEAAGVKFGESVEGDPLFCYAQLPPGWSKKGTDHSMHSLLLDEKGRKRASIFYKAASYDRKASLSVCLRYSVNFDYNRQEKDGVAISHVMDCETIIHSTIPESTAGKKSWEVTNQLAAQWLTEHFPNWKDAGAYWSD